MLIKKIEISRYDSYREPEAIDYEAGQPIPRVGDFVGGFVFHSGVVIEVRFDYEAGVVRIITGERNNG